MRFAVSLDCLLLFVIGLLIHLRTCSTIVAIDRTIYASEFLRRFGYLRTDSSSSSNELSSPAIRAFQRFIGVNRTGVIDEITWQKMRVPRCGNKDLRRVQRRKRFILQGSRWPSNEALTFRITKYPTTFPQQFVDAELTKALTLWSSASSLEFEHRKLKRHNDEQQHMDRKTDIRISFEIGDHGDTEPFDGPGNVLGHAFFPQYGGDAHFDNDEYWTMRSTEGVNLFQVAAHEFGHSLGLEHSNKADAIMAPFFKGYTPNFTLQEDDIRAIQALYGGKPSRILSPPLAGGDMETYLATSKQMAPSVKSSKINSVLCSDPEFDAIATIDDDTYIFKDNLVYRRTKLSMDSEYPKTIRDVFGRWEGGIWQTLPDKIDTALTWPDQQIFFFKGVYYWKTIRFQLQAGYPRRITDGFRGLDEQHFFTGRLNAAFVYSGDNHTYFIKDAMIWRLNINLEFSSSIDVDYPQFVVRWLKIGEKITGALQWINGKTYFFSHQSYYRFDHTNHRVEDIYPTYPRPIAEWWLQCNQASTIEHSRSKRTANRFETNSIDFDFLKNSSNNKRRVRHIIHVAVFTIITCCL